MKVDTFACDICAVQKKEVNHWFKGCIFLDKMRTRSIQISPWDSEYPLAHESKHFCGVEHAIKWASKTLAEPDVEKVADVPGFASYTREFKPQVLV